MDSTKVVKAIQTRIAEMDGDEVEELNLDNVKIDAFTPEINRELENIKTLLSLSLNECELTTLTNFPKLSSLIRLELMDNKIDSKSLRQLVKSCPNLQSLSLGGNPIKNYDDLKSMEALDKLYQLDLINCEICNKSDYRPKIFDMFKNLQILDNLTQNGEPYNYSDEDEDNNEEDQDEDPSDDDEEDSYNPEEDGDEDEEEEDDQDEDDDEFEARAVQNKRVKK